MLRKTDVYHTCCPKTTPHRRIVMAKHVTTPLTRGACHALLRLCRASRILCTMSLAISGGEMVKEDFRGVALRQCLNETMPLIHPIAAATALTLFVAMHIDDKEVTPLTPAQGPP
jgi:hypothetical protein